MDAPGEKNQYRPCVTPGSANGVVGFWFPGLSGNTAWHRNTRRAAMIRIPVSAGRSRRCSFKGGLCGELVIADKVVPSFLDGPGRIFAKRTI
ncbi:hypothetical protein GCM10009677_26940 [Sphaerisporangium rubeum]